MLFLEIRRCILTGAQQIRSSVSGSSTSRHSLPRKAGTLVPISEIVCMAWSTVPAHSLEPLVPSRALTLSVFILHLTDRPSLSLLSVEGPATLVFLCFFSMLARTRIYLYMHGRLLYGLLYEIHTHTNAQTT